MAIIPRLIAVGCPDCGKILNRFEEDDPHVHQGYCRSRGCEQWIWFTVQGGKPVILKTEKKARPAAVSAAPVQHMGAALCTRLET